MDQHEINEREWQDAANWHGGLLRIYSSEADSRFLVPKRTRWMGWTLNFAHPGARFLLAASAIALLLGLLQQTRR